MISWKGKETECAAQGSGKGCDEWLTWQPRLDALDRQMA